MAHTRDFFPRSSVNRGKMCVALGPDMDLGHLQAVGDVEPLCVDFRPADDSNFSG